MKCGERRDEKKNSSRRIETSIIIPLIPHKKKYRLEESNNCDFSSLHLLSKAIESPAIFKC